MQAKTAAAYARYSTDHQTSSSIEYQMRRIEEYCKANGITVTARFADEACTGTNTDRPAFQALCAAARAHSFQAVVVYDISRGSRDVADWFGFRREMALLGIEVISVEDKLGDILNPSDYLTELITVGLGQHHVLTSRQKSMDSVATKAKTGQFLGGYPPFGYEIRNGQYFIVPEEARIVRQIFDMYAAGESYNRILAAIGQVRGKRGRVIGSNSLHAMLKNERYIGVYTWCKVHQKIMGKYAGRIPNENAVRIEGAIPAIIDKETWEKVQARMSDKKRNACNKAKREYLLSGLIECTACGGTYVGHTTTSKGHEYKCYCCGTKYRNHTCNAKNINAEEIETFVVQNLKDYLLRLDFDTMAKKIADEINGAGEDLKAERAELLDVEAQLANGTRAILKGLDYPELQQEMFKLRVRKSELEDIVGRKNPKKPVDPEKIAAMLRSFTENWSTDLGSIVRSMVKIYAHADGSYDLNIGVHIMSCGSRI
ncbi:MAG: recombinase family protein [Oscillospiraceae bacterium]|nr:recombinase family protein [Oscillospiraceae bacterium]